MQPAGSSERSTPRRIIRKSRNGIGQSDWIPRLEQQAVDAVLHDVEQAAVRSSDNRYTNMHRFNGHHAERLGFGGRHNGDVRPAPHHINVLDERDEVDSVRDTEALGRCYQSAAPVLLSSGGVTHKRNMNAPESALPPEQCCSLDQKALTFPAVQSPDQRHQQVSRLDAQAGPK